MKYVKITTLIILLATFISGLSSCRKDDEYKHYDVPEWNVALGNYQVNMTAVVELPSYIEPYMTDKDQMAAFVNDSCRGVADIVDRQFFMVIKGNPDEQSKVTFRYYNARNRYLYEAREYVGFETDLILGNTDNPEVLPLKIKN
ncbi:MAG TPA: hypothetical protein VE870_10800 [Bacteroidales bacterium]|nr:hypothetical protein [Bacteroidales bacterium]